MTSSFIPGNYDTLEYSSLIFRKKNSEDIIEAYARSTENSNDKTFLGAFHEPEGIKRLNLAIWQNMTALATTEKLQDLQNDSYRHFIRKCLQETDYPFPVSLIPAKAEEQPMDLEEISHKIETFQKERRACEEINRTLQRILSYNFKKKDKQSFTAHLKNSTETTQKPLRLQISFPLWQKITRPAETERCSKLLSELEDQTNNYFFKIHGDGKNGHAQSFTPKNPFLNPFDEHLEERISARKQELEEERTNTHRTQRERARQKGLQTFKTNVTTYYTEALIGKMRHVIWQNHAAAYNIISARQAEQEEERQKQRAEKRQAELEHQKAAKIRMVKETVTARRSKEEDARYDLESNGIQLTSETQHPLLKKGRELAQKERAEDYQKTREEQKQQRRAAFKAKQKGR